MYIFSFQRPIYEHIYYIGCEVLAPVVMKSTVFWDITPCCPLKFNGRFGGTLLATCSHASFLLSLFFDSKDGGDISKMNWATAAGEYK
jgi:hypothetical protein